MGACEKGWLQKGLLPPLPPHRSEMPLALATTNTLHTHLAHTWHTAHTHTHTHTHTHAGLVNAGYKYSHSHTSPLAVKTDASMAVLWDLMRGQPHTRTHTHTHTTHTTRTYRTHTHTHTLMHHIPTFLFHSISLY
jgi:hypothetical protein